MTEDLTTAAGPVGDISILVVEDDDVIRTALCAALGRNGYTVRAAASAEEGLAQFQQDRFDVAITDLRLPGMGGRDFVIQSRALDPELVVIVMSGEGTSSEAIEAMALGAYDFFVKPFRVPELEIVMRRALEKRQLHREVRELRQQLRHRYQLDGLIGDSRRIDEVRRLIGKVARGNATVLILGESGTGKELVAELIHRNGPRQKGPLIRVNCAAIPEALLESELFGHERGAFTGAIAQRHGKLELAQGGTLFLDEVGDMPFAMQAKVLRVLEDREIFRVGASKAIRVDVRIIAATNKDMEDAVRAREIREDLYYRLNVFPITLPPLRDRLEDVPLLVEHFLTEMQPTMPRPVRGIAPDAMERLLGYSWPGNVRELRNCIERATIMGEGDIIELADLPLRFTSVRDRDTPNARGAGALDLDARLAAQERQWICEALAETGGLQVEAARLLGITDRSLWYRVKKLGVDVARIRADV